MAGRGDTSANGVLHESTDGAMDLKALLDGVDLGFDRSTARDQPLDLSHIRRKSRSWERKYNEESRKLREFRALAKKKIAQLEDQCAQVAAAAVDDSVLGTLLSNYRKTSSADDVQALLKWLIMSGTISVDDIALYHDSSAEEELRKTSAVNMSLRNELAREHRRARDERAVSAFRVARLTSELESVRNESSINASTRSPEGQTDSASCCARCGTNSDSLSVLSSPASTSLDHASSADVMQVKQLQLRLFRTKSRYRSTLAAKSQQLKELRDDVKKERQQFKSKLEAARADLECRKDTEWARKLDDVKKRMETRVVELEEALRVERAVKEADMAAMKLKHDMERREGEKNIADVRNSMSASLSSLNIEMKMRASEAERLLREQLESEKEMHEREVQTEREKHEKHVEDTVAAHAKELEAKSGEHAASLATLRDDHSAVLQKLGEEHEAKCKELNEELSLVRWEAEALEKTLLREKEEGAAALRKANASVQARSTDVDRVNCVVQAVLKERETMEALNNARIRDLEATLTERGEKYSVAEKAWGEHRALLEKYVDAANERETDARRELAALQRTLDDIVKSQEAAAVVTSSLQKSVESIKDGVSASASCQKDNMETLVEQTVARVDATIGLSLNGVSASIAADVAHPLDTIVAALMHKDDVLADMECEKHGS